MRSGHMGLGKGRKTPQSVKTKRKIDAAVDVALQQQSQTYVHAKEMDQVQINELKKQLQQALKQSGQIVAHSDLETIEKTQQIGFLVKNWHTAWKWISTWAFGLIAYVSVAGIPPELIALIPEASQGKATAVLAMLGFIGRFINQSRGK